MLVWRVGKRQSGEFCIGCNWIPCYCIRYRDAAITEHGSLSRDAMFCSSRIVHPYRRNQPWFQVYTSVCPRGARRDNARRSHWPQNMDGWQRRKIEAKRPPYWSSQKAVVTALLSMKVLWDIQEYDPNNAFLIKENMWKRTDVKYWCS